MIDLHEYGLSARYGFLPDEPQVNTLCDYYSPWEANVLDLPLLIKSRRIQSNLENLPILSMEHLLNESEWRRAYVVLAFLSNAYIWAGESPKERLPAPLSVPLINASEHFGLPPALTYTALCLWNHNIDTAPPELDFLSAQITFTGTVDESWFYLVSVIIEARGGIMVPLMLESLDAAEDGNLTKAIKGLCETSKVLTGLTILLKRVYEKCDPQLFYSQIRPFLAGSNGYTGGILLEDRAGTTFRRGYSGGSAGQSSLFQFLDVVLGTRNAPTPKTREDDFFKSIRSYMPREHRRFLEDMGNRRGICELVKTQKDESFTRAHNDTVKALNQFREAHIQVVTRYIVLPAKRAEQDTGLELKGTAGSALIPFLKHARDETLNSLIRH